MSEICIKYNDIEDVITYSEKARSWLDNYVSDIRDVINSPIGKLEGADTKGYAQSAADLASKKMTALTDKKIFFSNLENTAKNIMSTAKTADANVATNIANLADGYIGERSWSQKVGDWIYNTFCVEFVNSNDLLRDFFDCVKWACDKIGNVIESVRDWFKYGNGRYVWKIVSSVVGAIVAVAGAIVAFCAIPFFGGLSIPLVIGCIGALATSVGAIITVVNSGTSIYSNGIALYLASGDNTGAARYYGNVSTLSQYWAKRDLGDAEENADYQFAGEVIDTTKVVADTTAFVCNILSLGNVRDYRVTTRNDNINFRYNQNEWYKGYSFTYENIRRNIMHDMGYKISSGTLKDSAFKFNLLATDKVTKYTFSFGNFKLVPPENLVNFFNIAKSTQNTMKFAENLDGMFEFIEDEEKDLEDVADGVKSLTGLLTTTKWTSIFDRYGTKGGTTIANLLDLVFE